MTVLKQMDLPDPTVSTFNGPTWIDWSMIALFVVFVAGMFTWASLS